MTRRCSAISQAFIGMMAVAVLVENGSYAAAAFTGSLSYDPSLTRSWTGKKQASFFETGPIEKTSSSSSLFYSLRGDDDDDDDISSVAPDQEDKEEEDDNEEDDDAEHELSMLNELPAGLLAYPWTLPNDFEHFLNQCTIQSFMFLCKSMRDPQTVLWIEEFTQPEIRLKQQQQQQQQRSKNNKENSNKNNIFTSKLLLYHGLAAMNTTLFPTWESYFQQLLEQPKKIFLVESSRSHIPSYELDINPPSLCTRMISVREQIAREFVHDLDVIARLGGYTIHSYWEGLQRIRDQQKQQQEQTDDNRQETPFHMERPNLLFLDMDPSRGGDLDYKPSPLRQGNFDLLYLLTTQKAIHRVLNQFHEAKATSNAKYQKDDDDASSSSSKPPALDRCSYQFLRNFYTQRLTTHFCGAKRYGRADDLLEELMTSNPTTVQVSDSDTPVLVDPMAIATRILEERQNVAFEWQDRAKRIPEIHTNIRKLQFSLLMGITSTTTTAAEKTEAAETTSTIHQSAEPWS